MLGKLLKYELRATGRTFWPLFLGILIFGLITRYFAQGYSDSSGLTYDIMQGVSIFIYGALIMSSFVAILIVIIQRFYRNLLGAEGYLMFTLPVKPGQLIFSKVLATFIWYIIAGIVVCISLIFIFGELYMIDDVIAFFQYEFPYIAEDIRLELGIPWGLAIAEILLPSVIAFACNLLMLYAAISLGHLSAKSKKLTAFVAFIILTTLTGVVTTVVYSITGLGNILAYYTPLVEQMSVAAFFHYNMLANTLIYAAFGTLSYFLIRWVFAKKLNIE